MIDGVTAIVHISSSEHADMHLLADLHVAAESSTCIISQYGFACSRLTPSSNDIRDTPLVTQLGTRRVSPPIREVRCRVLVQAA